MGAPSSGKTSADDGPLTAFAFPRTGKRGVPQQFPRRLYEMLEKETALVHASDTGEGAWHAKVITWSGSGRAFTIFDVDEFSEVVLPRYFRTSKFSSFQRNLNLYGFTKVRRGPDTDMYAHQAFVRSQPETLLQLRKINGTAQRRTTFKVSNTSLALANDKKHRPVSPSPPNSVGSDSCPSSADNSPVANSSAAVITEIPTWAHIAPDPFARESLTKIAPRPSKLPWSDDRGKLDLLTMALERQEAMTAI